MNLSIFVPQNDTKQNALFVGAHFLKQNYCAPRWLGRDDIVIADSQRIQ